MKEYYEKRAREYEKIYEKPERQESLGRLKDILPGYFTGKDVVEIACGTGYWTEVIARQARSIHALDINREVLDVAMHKYYGRCTVRFDEADAFHVPESGVKRNAGFAAFWFSHILIPERDRFMKSLAGRLDDGAPVVFIDNLFVEGSSTPLSRTDDDGNTYQLRKLDSGDIFEVLKNFPVRDEMTAILNRYCSDVEYLEFKYFWLAKGYVRKK